MSSGDGKRETGDRRMVVSRRSVLRLAIGSVPVLLAACGGAAAPASSAPASSPTSAPASAAAKPSTAASASPSASAAASAALKPSASVAASAAASAGQPVKVGSVTLPTYMPLNLVKPDLPPTVDGVDPAWINYPTNNPKAVTTPPGKGGDVTIMTWNLGSPLLPVDQNPPWQQVNKDLNVNLKLNIVPLADYTTKLQAVIAGGDVPDIVYSSNSPVPSFPEFLKSQCADLTPFVSGDAIKDYPNLANLPTRAWKAMIFNNAIYGIPNVFNWILSWGLYVHQELVDEAGGAQPKNLDEYKKIMGELNKPQQGVYAMTTYSTPSTTAFNVISGLYPAMFGAPNNWKVDTNGAFTRSFETDQYKAAVSAAKDLVAAGIYTPNSISQNTVGSKAEFASRKAATDYDGWNGTGTVLFWDQAATLNPPSKIRVWAPIAAEGGKPTYFFGRSGSMLFLKKASPDRIKELLGVINYFASPFGTAEHLLLRYGVKDVDYTRDDKGNPILTDKGQKDANLIWPYICTPPQYLYYPKNPDFAPVMQGAEKPMVEAGIDDPTVGLYANTQLQKGVTIDGTFNSGVGDIVAGRRPLSDLDGLVKDWKSSGGDQIRQEYQAAYKAANG